MNRGFFIFVGAALLIAVLGFSAVNAHTGLDDIPEGEDHSQEFVSRGVYYIGGASVILIIGLFLLWKFVLAR